MSLALDGYAANSGGSNGGVSSGSVSLTTSDTNDIIVLAIFSEDQNMSGPYPVSSVSGGGLSWNKRGSVTGSNNNGQDLEIWWAYAASALSSTTISFNFSHAVDGWSAFAFGVNGANTSTPWDGNASLPTTYAGNPIYGMSTTAADTFAFVVGGSGSTYLNSGDLNSPFGTQIGAPSSESSGHASASCIGGYEIAAAPLDNAEINISNGQLIYGDAIVAAAETPSTGSPDFKFEAMQNQGRVGSGSSLSSISLTEVDPDDVIVWVVHYEADQTSDGYGGGYATTTTISDTDSLSWMLRKRVQWQEASGTWNTLEVWWAVATTRHVGGTWSLTGTPTNAVGGQGIDGALQWIFNASGCHTAAPWDTSSGNPVSATNTSDSAGADTTLTGCYTLDANALAFVAIAGTSYPFYNQTFTAPTGGGTWTQDHTNNTSGANYKGLQTAYLQGVQLSNQTVTFSNPNSNFGVIFDALTSDVPYVPPSGTWASNEADDTWAASGGVLGGVWASTEATDIMDVSSAPFGMWASTDTKDAMASIGYPELSGVWASTEATDTIAVTTASPLATYFNPVGASSGIDFQNLDLTIINQEAFGLPVGALSNTSHSTGKFYAEFTTWFGSNQSGLGIANSTTTFADFGTALGTIPGYATGGAGIFQDLNGTIWINGVEQPNWQGVSLAGGQNIGIAVDLVANLIWFRVNGGHWNGIAAANPATGAYGYDISGLTGGPIYLIGEVVGAYDTINMNAGSSAFVYAAPSGFPSWDSAPQAGSPIQLDGYATNGVSEVSGDSYSAVTEGTITLSTTKTDDVIVLGIAMGGFWTAAQVDSVTSTSGLVWKRRNRRWQVGGYKTGSSTTINQGLDIEIWWAHAPAALIGEVITVHTAGVGSMSLVAFGVSGANYVAPWDLHTQAGGYIDNIGNISYFPPTAELSTKASNALLFGFHGDTTADAGATHDPWTYVASATANEHAGYSSFLSLVYQTVEEPQSNTDVVVGIGAAYVAASMMFDSIVAAGEAGTATEIFWFWDSNSVNNIIQLSTGNSLVLNYSATNFNLMVLIEVVIMSASGLGEVSSISEGQGSLSSTGFERRSRTVTATPKGTMAVEIWWGWMPMYTSAERANNDTITINTDHTASGDIVGAIMWGLGGSTGAFGLGDPFWDVNPAVPATNSSTGNSPPPYATDISTTIPSGLLVAWTANNTENVPGFTDPFITLVQSYPNTVSPYMQLNSTAPPLYTGFEFLYEPGLATSETAEFLNGSPEPDGWIVIADAIPVGPPQPPTGTMHISDTPDTFTHTGSYTAIGIASPGGWVGLLPLYATMATTDREDICGGTPNLGYSPFLGEGWLGCVPAFAAWHSTEGDGDDMALYGWVLGFGITGQMNAAEVKDRLAFSHVTSVTGMMGAVEAKDRWASAGLVLPPGHIHPTVPRKRRLLIIT